MTSNPVQLFASFSSREDLEAVISQLMAAGFAPELLHQSVLEHAPDSLPLSGVGLMRGGILGCIIGMILGWITCSSLLGMKLVGSNLQGVDVSALLPTIECIIAGAIVGGIVGLLISAALRTGLEHRKSREYIALKYRLFIACNEEPDELIATKLLTAGHIRSHLLKKLYPPEIGLKNTIGR